MFDAKTQQVLVFDESAGGARSYKHLQEACAARRDRGSRAPERGVESYKDGMRKRGLDEEGEKVQEI